MSQDDEPPANDEQQELLKAILSTSDRKLTKKVAEAEGLENGSSVKPIYSQRHIKFYHITEHELSAISLANLGATGLVSLGSAFLAFWLDIFKDTLLAQQVPPVAEEAVSYAEPVCLFLGVAFWAFGIGIHIWRRRYISEIKKQSHHAEVLNVDGYQASQ